MATATRPLSIAISLLAISCSSYRQAGIRDAKSDFGNGIMQIETYGYPMLKSPYEEHLRKNGIKINWVAGCMVDQKTLEHAAGYNPTMKRLINQRLGKNIFKEAEKYASAEYARNAKENY